MKNLFLTGDINIGKSTLIKKFINSEIGKNFNYSGFKTIPFFNDDKKSFIIKYYNETTLKSKSNYEIVGLKKEKEKGFYGITKGFETLGCEILRDSLKKKHIVIMDELGFFELQANNFKELVLRNLDSDNFVLGVIKKKENPFLKEIIKREDVCVIEVSKENREEKLLDIKKFFI
ncbi:nucleoside-triphosphatase [Peptostreptococcaceae bacterium AGR-M142]